MNEMKHMFTSEASNPAFSSEASDYIFESSDDVEYDVKITETLMTDGTTMHTKQVIRKPKE